MNLSNTYYNDLRKMDTLIEKQYDKYYELHKLKHSEKSASKRAFTQRIQQYWWSVWQAIREPKAKREYKAIVTMRSYWRGYTGNKVSYGWMAERIRNWMEMSEAIKPLTGKKLSSEKMKEFYNSLEVRRKVGYWYFVKRYREWYPAIEAVSK